MKVKICGITRFEDAFTAVENGADAIGFIFYEKSPRYISPKNAVEIISKLPEGVIKIGVFVDENILNVNNIANDLLLDFVQLHGNENLEYINNVNHKVIKAFRVNESFNFNILYRYKDTLLLLDSFSKNAFGGTGKKFDWNQIPSDLRNKIILAGGIKEEDIFKIKDDVNPFAVDISSSIEVSPGVKDKTKLKSILKTINRLEGKLC